MKPALKIIFACLVLAAPILYWFLSQGKAVIPEYKLLRFENNKAINETVSVPLEQFQNEKFGVVLNDGILLFPEKDNKYPGYFDLSLNTRDYNTLHLKLRANKDTACRLNWSTDIAPDLKFNHGILIEIKAGDTFQDYVVPLPQEDGLWSGTTSQMQFNSFWTTPAQVEMQSMAFEFREDAAPQRYTAKGKEHKTMPATPYPPDAWSFQVPPNAQMQTAVAFGNLGWKPYQSNGASVSISLKAEGEESKVLFERKLDPVANEIDRNWQHITADLSEYAGKNVKLEFTLDNMDDPTGDFVFWKEPIVFTKSDFATNIPIFLISLDTVRADHLSVYGYERDTTPWMKQWAQSDAVVFEHAVTPDAWTLPAHTTMLTGLYPQNHRVTPETHLDETVETLPELLQKNAYVTLGQTSVLWWLEAKHGFAQGFDQYAIPQPYQDTFKTTASALETLDAFGTRRVFQFMHIYDAHGKSHTLGYTFPYQAEKPEYMLFSKAFNPAPTLQREGGENLNASNFLIAANQKKLAVTPEEKDYITALYDDCILSIDGALAQFVEGLKSRGMYDNALIIITADHGEAFNENGLWLHELCTQSCSHIPFIVKFPLQQHGGKRFAPTVELVDIFPTVLEVLGVKTQNILDGESLLAQLEKNENNDAFSYTRRHDTNAVYYQNWKLMKNAKDGAYQLYDLSNDPSEQTNLFDSAPPVLEKMKEELEQFYAGTLAGISTEETPNKAGTLTENEKRELEALGYLQ